MKIRIVIFTALIIILVLTMFSRSLWGLSEQIRTPLLLAETIITILTVMVLSILQHLRNK